MSTINMNPYFNDAELISGFQKAFKNKQSFKKDGVVNLLNNPFQCCEMLDFITDRDYLNSFKKKVMAIKYKQKNNDLYKFKQSNSLRNIKSDLCQQFIQLLQGSFKHWLSLLTGIELQTSNIDVTASIYDYTDVLLCHDDELESRRIAYVLYLVDGGEEGWCESDGGLLDLFENTASNEPGRIVTSLTPSFNKMTWFEVTEASHHQVSEVLSKEKKRVSVHGWFHSKPVPRPIRSAAEMLPLPIKCLEVEEGVVREWVNDTYLDRVTQTQIRIKFEATSEIQLPNFLNAGKYKELLEALSGLPWSLQGPLNRRKYYTWQTNLTPNQANNKDENNEANNNGNDSNKKSEDIVKDFLHLFHSEAMFLILSNLTGLRFHRYIPIPTESDNEYDEDDDEEEEDDEGEEDVVEKVKDRKRCGVEGDDVESKKIKLDNTTQSSVVENRETAHETDGEGGKDVTENGGKKGGDGVKDVLDDASNVKDPVDHGPCDAKCSHTLRRFSHSCYTTANDRCVNTNVLEALMVMPSADWDYDWGGHTTYIAKDEDDELMNIRAPANSLNLVYREKDTLSFVKYINHRRNQDCLLYDSLFTYYE